jgi:hypothetical protein
VGCSLVYYLVVFLNQLVVITKNISNKQYVDSRGKTIM